MAEKQVTTVTGDISGDKLGITLPHEHIHLKFDVARVEVPKHVPTWPTSEKGKDFFNLKNLGLLRQYPFSVQYNITLADKDSQEIMQDELLRYKQLGGKTIVENTITGISRNVRLLKELSLSTGVNIIAGTGYYIAASQDPDILNVSVEEMVNIMTKELNEGCEDTGIKCGVIGEIGCSYPLHPFEKKVIQAVAIVQSQTNKPVTFHPGRNPESPFDIIRCFSEAGGKVQDVIMSHLDRTIHDKERLLEFANFKTFTQFDLFGTETSFYQLNEEVDMPSDGQRIQRLQWLKENGNLDQILMSHDIHSKHRLANFGGHGYGHILQNVVPKMKKHRGFSQEDLGTILIHNPRRWLCG